MLDYKKIKAELAVLSAKVNKLNEVMEKQPVNHYDEVVVVKTLQTVLEDSVERISKLQQLASDRHLIATDEYVRTSKSMDDIDRSS